MSFEAPFDKRGNCALLGAVLRSSRVKEKGVYHRSFGHPIEHTSAVFLSAVTSWIARLTMFACVLASNWRLASGQLVSGNTFCVGS